MMRWAIALLAALAVALAVLQLETGRRGIEITAFAIPDGPPATLYHLPGTGPAPGVVIAHGFAGSRQLMEPFALTLARAGYVVTSYDLLGHGRNPQPMSGDVTRIDGTTRLLVAETRAVAKALLAHPLVDGRLAFLGHSMASDIVIRAALEAPQAGAVVAVSMFSQAVTADAPPNLLVIVGDWEARLKVEALRVLALTDPAAGPGQTVGDTAAGTARQVVFAPAVEHVGVLYSGTALREAADWLNAAFGRAGPVAPAMRGGWIALLLVGLTALAWPLARVLPSAAPAPPLPKGRFWLAAALPALLVPFALWPVQVQVLPVLVADHLALHFLLWGVAVLVLLRDRLRGALTAPVLMMAVGVAVWGIAVFGGALDRYVASFAPHPGRVLVIAGLIPGAVAAMLADALLTEGGRAGLVRVLAARGLLIGSLMIAVALDFDRLMFLLIILPVLVLFFLLFGTLGGWVGRRSGRPAAAGIGLGLVLAWSLGVSFPLFSP